MFSFLWLPLFVSLFCEVLCLSPGHPGQRGATVKGDQVLSYSVPQRQAFLPRLVYRVLRDYSHIRY